MADRTPDAHDSLTVTAMRPARKFWPVTLGLWGVVALILAWNVVGIDLSTRDAMCGTPLAMAEMLWFMCAAPGAALAILVGLIDARRRGTLRIRRVYAAEIAVFFLSAALPLTARWLF